MRRGGSDELASETFELLGVRRRSHGSRRAACAAKVDRMNATRSTPSIGSQRDRERRAVRSITNSLVLLLPSSAVALVAWLVPIDILERLPWLRAVASQLGMDSAITRTAEVSAFPQVSFVVHLVVALLLPPLSLWAALRMFRWRDVLPPDGPDFRVSRALGMAFVAFALVGCAVFALFWLPGDPGFCEGCTTQSRVGLGVVLACATYAIPLATGLGLWRLYAVMEYSGRIKR